MDSVSGSESDNVTRRNFMAGGVAAGAGAVGAVSARADDSPDSQPAPLKGKLKQSVCKWCFKKTSMEDLAAFAASIGLKSVELVRPDDWPTLKKHGLICAMTPSHGIRDGLNRIENHDDCLGKIRQSIEDCAEAGFPNVICFSGNRGGMDDGEGLENCVTALKQVVGLAEKKKITICMELLNSKRNHKDYMCDRTHWGVELVKRVGSPRFRLLYDIYHMQVQEGDVIATIQENHESIGHYHTAGVPGRHEFDETQELQYAAITRAILDTGYQGYYGHEFIPAGDPLASLAAAAHMCDL